MYFYDIKFQLVPLWKYKPEPLTANEPVVPVGKVDCFDNVIIVDKFTEPVTLVIVDFISVNEPDTVNEPDIVKSPLIY